MFRDRIKRIINIDALFGKQTPNLIDKSKNMMISSIIYRVNTNPRTFLQNDMSSNDGTP